MKDEFVAALRSQDDGGAVLPPHEALVAAVRPSPKRTLQPPLRPHFDSEGIALPDNWDSLEDADVLVDPESKHSMVHDVGDEEVDVDSGVAVQVPRGLPAPPQPSKEEKARHDLTHINYRSWCPHCVFGRRNNTPHRTFQSGRRNIPLFCADDCVLVPDANSI